MEIVDSNQQVFGYIRKQSGIKPKDFHLFDTEQNYVGAIQTTWINKKYVVVDREKKSVLEMPIMTSGIDYDVKDIEKDRNIASIRKRTLVTYGGQANLSREGFYMPIMDLPDRTLMIIGLCYVLNFYIQT
ncbi:hypothetical protein [Piscibacillus halophilus]|uniref:hypothetical protein n=1 Tax=Piscibacillus halophilus TaxID=571933 RepID=UPI00158E5C21|nr:hypothetical protein [Piscibacillus halophilus]